MSFENKSLLLYALYWYRNSDKQNKTTLMPVFEFEENLNTSWCKLLTKEYIRLCQDIFSVKLERHAEVRQTLILRVWFCSGKILKISTETCLLREAIKKI